MDRKAARRACLHWRLFRAEPLFGWVVLVFTAAAAAARAAPALESGLLPLFSSMDLRIFTFVCSAVNSPLGPQTRTVASACSGCWPPKCALFVVKNCSLGGSAWHCLPSPHLPRCAAAMWLVVGGTWWCQSVSEKASAVSVSPVLTILPGS